jgi:Domain of unknown function (DUF4440)
MKKMVSAWLVILIAGIFITACSATKNSPLAAPYKPDDEQLYNTIVQLDSLFFAAYNSCSVNLEAYASFYSDSIRFYHDKGGVMNVKEDIVASTKKYVCGKVTRELVPGSIEVYPIKDFGAVEMGMHRFHNNQEKETTPSHAGKFVIIWQYKNKEWKITEVVSLH